LILNEIRYASFSSPIGEQRELAFVEVYNKSAVGVSLSNHSLLRRDGSTVATLPSLTLPAKGFLTVLFGPGVDDTDFSDGEGTFYTQGVNDGVFEAEDELGLYGGAAGPATIIDFVAWSGTGSYAGGIPHGHAVSASIWTSGAFVDTSGFSPEQGEDDDMNGVLGLTPTGYDTNSVTDWRQYDWETYFVGSLHTAPNPMQVSPADGVTVETALVTFQWAHMPAAVSYQLLVDNNADFSSPETNITLSGESATVPVADGESTWRVESSDASGTVLVDPKSGYKIARTTQVTTPQVPITRLIQHKDTGMLCIVRGGTYRRGDNGGCSETPSARGPWDAAHPEGHARSGCPHCSHYCARAAIAMINHQRGGNLSQDRISHELFKDDLTGPEGDLGHKLGADNFLRVDQTLAWALNGATVTHTLSNPDFDEIRTEIDAGRVIMVGSVGHAMIVNGYRNSPTAQVHIVNPWPDSTAAIGRSGWMKPGKVGIVVWWKFAGTPTGRLEEPGVTADGDGDGLVDFDEGARFPTSPANPDSDGDLIGDKREIRSYTFHENDLHPSDIGVLVDSERFPDIDQDGKRAEVDIDTDAGGVPDTFEDDNLNGVAKDQTGETDVFSKDDDPFRDCNQNTVHDEQDIKVGTSLDCNGNKVPDECICTEGGPTPCEPDADGDGVIDPCDGCPSDPAKATPGVCGCGTPDTDTDGDGTADCHDNCPTDPNKTAPGQCGCGIPDVDTDGDGTADCHDNCPTDPNKTAPGQCGCGIPDVDSDADGVANCNDLCPNDSAKTTPGQCGCGVPDIDSDGDGVANCNDPCPNNPGVCSAPTGSIPTLSAWARSVLIAAFLVVGWYVLSSRRGGY
jgi:hypothetical protein